MDRAATGRLYTYAVAGRVVFLVAVLLVSGACASDGEPDSRAVAGPLHGPWRPVPITLVGPIVETVDRACRASMDDFPQETRLMVIDTRGGGRIQAQYAGPRSTEASCIDMTIDAMGQVVAGGGGTGFGAQEWSILNPFELEHHGGYSSGESSTTMGRAGPGIAKVVIVMPAQPRVTASLENGWYLVWRPGSWPPGTKVVGLDPLGQRVTEAPIE